MLDLTTQKMLFISQKKEMVEVFTDFETKNKYAILDESGQQVLFAAEKGGGFFMRQFLNTQRSFEMDVIDKNQNLFLKFRRPFKFFWDELSIFDSNDVLLGTIKWQFAILKKKFLVLGKMGEELCRIEAPALKPWTFKLLKEENQIGQITKRWSGALKEMFTDADNFTVEFPLNFDHSQRALLLGALILIDFKYFEKKNN
jgi:uncharacterized protein YxjI